VQAVTLREGFPQHRVGEGMPASSVNSRFAVNCKEPNATRVVIPQVVSGERGLKALPYPDPKKRPRLLRSHEALAIRVSADCLWELMFVHSLNAPDQERTYL
jgi:hypothetical protein